MLSKRFLGRMVAYCAWMGVALGVVEAAEGNNGPRIITKCLFVGDSITWHGPAEDLAWTGKWGMAASRAENDYVHQVYRRICDAQAPYPKPQLLISGRDTGTAGRINNALRVLDQLQAFKADLIVIQLGENERDEEVTPEGFKKPYEKLVVGLKGKHQPLILCTGVWSPGAQNPYPAESGPARKQKMIQEVCRGEGCVFVDIAPIACREENAARSEKKYTHWGVGWHPGDRGMKGYADALWEAIRPNLQPVPFILEPVDKLTGIVPEPRRVFRIKGRQDPFPVSSKTTIFIAEKASELVEKGVLLLKKDIKTLYGFDIPVKHQSMNYENPFLFLINDSGKIRETGVALLGGVKNLPLKGKEGYRLMAGAHGLLIDSVTPPGLFYGIQTLRQMLRSDGTVPALGIADWPDQAIRACYVGFPTDPEGIVSTLARLKLNMCIVESRWYAGGNWWYNPSGNNRREAERFFSLCRSNNIEPVPLVQGLGWAYGVVDINPNCAEGVWVPNERHLLKGTEPVKLDHPNVIRTNTAPMIVTNLDQTKRYIEGLDYRVIPGGTVRPFEVTNTPWQIARIEGKGIADGREIRVDYNYMTYSQHQSPYCPAEPLTYEIVDGTLKNVIELYHPRYIHIGHDEVIHIRRCRRCLQSGKTAGELLAGDIRHWYDVIKRADPKITLLMWDDLLRESHPGGSVLASIPPDILICPWAYGAKPEDDKEIRERLTWFVDKNHRPVLGAASGYWHENIRLWNEAVKPYETNANCLGFMFTQWGESPNLWSALSCAAEYMWSHRRMEKPIFDLYAQTDQRYRNMGMGSTLSAEAQREEMAKQVNRVTLSGKNPAVAAEEFAQTIKASNEKLSRNIIPELAGNLIAAETIPERPLTQMEVLADYYRAMGLYCQAQMHAAQGQKEQARDQLSRVSDILKRRGINRSEETDRWLRHYENQGTFPSSRAVFDVDLKPLSLSTDKGIACPMAGLENRIKGEGKGYRIYDWGTVRKVSRLEINGLGKGEYVVEISDDGVKYDPVGKLTGPLESSSLTWKARPGRSMRITWANAVPTVTRNVTVYVLKSPARYACLYKSSDQWSTETFWDRMPVAGDFVLSNAAVSEWQTRAQAAYDEQNLYMRFTCDIPDNRTLTVQPENSGTEVWEDDCVQVFVRRDGDEKVFYQVVVNAAGRTFTRVHGGPDKSVQIRAVCERKPDRWTCAMAIPLRWITSDKIKLGQTWRVNFTRQQNHPYQLTSWAVLPEGAPFWFLQPEHFGAMVFERK